MNAEKPPVEKIAKVIETKTDKERLDTIRETLNDTLRISVKKLDPNPPKLMEKSKPITSILKKPQNLVAKIPSNKTNIDKNESTKKSSFGLIKSAPVRTKSKNEVKAEPVKTQTPRVKLSSNETQNDVLNVSFQSTLTTNSSASKSTICPSSDIGLEICTSRLSSAENSYLSKSQVNIVEPKEPVIFTMFENYPQPYNVALVKTEKKLKPKSGTAKKATSAKKIKSAPVKTNYQKFNQKKGRNKILVSQEIDVNLQKEIDQSMYNDLDDSEFEENMSVSSKNSVNYLSDNEKEISEINLEHNGTSANTKAAQIAINSKTNRQDGPESDQAKMSSQLNKDFVKSIEDRLFAIYAKYDNLLMQQENQEKSEMLNNQKAEFSEEMAIQLKDNIDFAQENLDSNQKRLKELYEIAKENSEKKVISKSSTSSDSKKENTLKRIDSFRSNTKDTKNSIKSTNTAELTIVPSNRNIFKLPPDLSDKINTLMIPLPNEIDSINFNQINHQEKINKNSKINLNVNIKKIYNY